MGVLPICSRMFALFATGMEPPSYFRATCMALSSYIVHEPMVLLSLQPHCLPLFTERFQGQGGEILIQPGCGLLPNRLSDAASLKGAGGFFLPLAGNAVHQDHSPFGRQNDILHGDLVRGPGQEVATLGPPFAFEDARSLEPLEDLLQVAWGDVLAA